MQWSSFKEGKYLAPTQGNKARQGKASKTNTQAVSREERKERKERNDPTASR